MNRRNFLKTIPTMATLTGAAALAEQTESLVSDKPIPSFAQDTNTTAAGNLQPIVFVKPEKEGGKGVLTAIQERQTIRSIKPDKLPPQMLSNLLWAAFGINRTSIRGGRVGRTAASASNSQEIDLYVALPEGVYIYEASGHRLMPVVAGDFRKRSGRGAAATAPVNIFFVVDLAKFNRGQPQEPNLKDPEGQKSYYFVDTGLIAQNVYLFAASQGLAAWFHNCDKVNTPKEFNLRPEQRVLFSQTVGYPA